MPPTATRRRTTPEGPSMQSATARGASATKLPARKRRGDPLWARLMVILGALIMMVSGGAIVGGKVLIGQVRGGIEQRHLLGNAGVQRGAIHGPLNLLLVGGEQRPVNETDLIRSYAIIIVSINHAH